MVQFITPSNAQTVMDTLSLRSTTGINPLLDQVPPHLLEFIPIMNMSFIKFFLQRAILKQQAPMIDQAARKAPEDKRAWPVLVFRPARQSC